MWNAFAHSTSFCQDLPTCLFLLFSIHVFFNSNIRNPTPPTPISSIVVLPALKYQAIITIYKVVPVLEFCSQKNLYKQHKIVDHILIRCMLFCSSKLLYQLLRIHKFEHFRYSQFSFQYERPLHEIQCPCSRSKNKGKITSISCSKETVYPLMKLPVLLVTQVNFSFPNYTC